MTTDNRTNEQLSGNHGQFTEAQVEAAAKAMWDLRKLSGEPEWDVLEYGVKSEYRKDARAALVAAQGAAPQKHPTFEEIGEDIARGIRDSLSGVAPQEPNQNETKSGNNFVSLDPEKVAAQGAEPQAESADCDRDRMGICKRCGMGWDARKVLEGDFACPVLPSSAESPVEPFKTWFACWWKNEPNAIAESNAQSAFYAGWDARGLPSSGVDEDKLAEAWEAGCLAGGNRKHHTNMTEEQAEKAWPNPYREGQVDTRG